MSARTNEQSKHVLLPGNLILILLACFLSVHSIRIRCKLCVCILFDGRFSTAQNREVVVMGNSPMRPSSINNNKKKWMEGDRASHKQEQQQRQKCPDDENLWRWAYWNHGHGILYMKWMIDYPASERSFPYANKQIYTHTCMHIMVSI